MRFWFGRVRVWCVFVFLLDCHCVFVGVLRAGIVCACVILEFCWNFRVELLSALCVLFMLFSIYAARSCIFSVWAFRRSPFCSLCMCPACYFTLLFFLKPRNHGATKPRNHGSTDPRIHGSTGPWSHGTTDPRNHGTTKPWSHGTTEPRIHRSTEPHIHGTTEPWTTKP